MLPRTVRGRAELTVCTTTSLGPNSNVTIRSVVQLAAQPSPPVLLPSSHSSSGNRIPLPQKKMVLGDVGVFVGVGVQVADGAAVCVLAVAERVSVGEGVVVGVSVSVGMGVVWVPPPSSP